MKVKLKLNHWWPRWKKVWGTTVYPYILINGNQSDYSHEDWVDLIRHEWDHVTDLRDFMDAFPSWMRFISYLMWHIRYGWRYITKGYRNVPTEKHAYAEGRIHNSIPEDAKKELGLN